MKVYKIMEKFAVFVVEIHCYHMNVDGLAFHVDEL